MWLVTQHGFFNIVQSDDDAKKELLTIKARRREDLDAFGSIVPGSSGVIQESEVNDYRFRMKIPRECAVAAIAEMVGIIDYPKTKGRLAHTHPDRTSTYLTTWFNLLDLQDE
jgi:hypothetical protein